MQVILIQDISTLGATNEIVKVKDGYARNYLIPQKFAVEASKTNVKILNEKLKYLQIKEKKMLAEIQKVIKELSSAVIKIKTKVGTQGKIFGTITNIVIAREIKNQKNFQIDRKKIILPENIKELGMYEGTIEFTPHISTTFKFEILSEETP